MYEINRHVGGNELAGWDAYAVFAIDVAVVNECSWKTMELNRRGALGTQNALLRY